jgi:hypothetical protein
MFLLTVSSLLEHQVRFLELWLSLLGVAECLKNLCVGLVKVSCEGFPPPQKAE